MQKVNFGASAMLSRPFLLWFRFILMLVVSPLLWASDKDSTIRSLDAEVQVLKKEVTQLNRDLVILEEELLFPASSKVSVFLALDIGKFFTLESVKVTINKKIVTSHIYSLREVNALQRGAVQRLFFGNYKPGKHKLMAVFTGKGPRGREYSRGTTYQFEKQKNSTVIELTVTDAVKKQQPEFEVKEW